MFVSKKMQEMRFESVKSIFSKYIFPPELSVSVFGKSIGRPQQITTDF